MPGALISLALLAPLHWCAATRHSFKLKRPLCFASCANASVNQVNVLDTDFFVTRLGDISDCNELIGMSLISKAQKAGRKLDYYAKTALVLHNKENRVGHQLVHLLHGHGHSEKTHNVESFQSSLRNASRDSAEHVPTMARLRLLDLRYYEHVHGFTVGKYCQGSMGSEAAQLPGRRQ